METVVRYGHFAALRDRRVRATIAGIMIAGALICLDLGLGLGADLAVANSVFQASIFISGLWGILVFKELCGRNPIALFLCAAVTLFGGILCVIYSGA